MQNVSKKNGLVAYRIVVFNKSVRWHIWSYCVTFTIAGLMLFDIISSIIKPRGDVNKLYTLALAHIIYDISNAVSILVLQILCITQSRALAKTIMLISKCTNYKYTIETRFCKMDNFTKFYCISGLSSLTTTLYCTVSHPIVESDTLVTVTLVVRYIMHDVILIIYSVIYHDLIRLIADLIDNILYELKWASIKLQVIANHTTISHKSTLFEIASNPKQKLGMTSQLRRNNIVTRNVVFSNNDLYSRHLKIFNVYRIHRQLNKLIEKIMNALMLINISYLMITLFYSCLWSELNLFQRTLNITHLMVSVIPTIYINNIPNHYNNEVSND